MTWLLTIWLIAADGTASKVPVGLMINEDICGVAGAGIEAVLAAEQAPVTVVWECEYVGGDA